jgi:YVTN family beta-propeller protein
VSRFTIESEPPLAIRGISPSAGPAGSQAVISGAGFSPQASANAVFLNGVRLPVSLAGDRALVVSLPHGVTSGSLTVRVDALTSNPLPWKVLDPSRTPGGMQGSAAVGNGARDMAVTPDGAAMYVTQSQSNSVSVVSLRSLGTVAVIPVGQSPAAIAMLDDPRRAYVANRLSHDLSVIDADSSSASWNHVVATIPVGRSPSDVVVSALGPRVLVACAGDSTLAMLDAHPGSGTFDRVVKTVKLGSSSTAVAVSPDGGRAYAGGTRAVVVDLRSDVGEARLPSRGRDAGRRCSSRCSRVVNSPSWILSPAARAFGSS